MDKRGIEKWIDQCKDVSISKEELQQFLTVAYNLGLQDAADNSEVKTYWEQDNRYYEVDKESILKLKL
jgi:predicted DNA-binding protein (MmcQ/YjbR family)